jgi:multidrug efflux pump subunit AcrA (membrane-fusion protein)
MAYMIFLGERHATKTRLLVFFVILLFLCASCSGGQETPLGPKVVEWGEAGPGDVVRVVEAQGVVRARDKGFIRVGSRVGGQILRMHVRTGDVVRAGQLLAEIDDRELQAMRRQAMAKLESARNELSRAKPLGDKRLEAAGASLTANRSRQSYADKNLERKQSLSGAGHLAQNDLDASRRDAATAAQTVAQDKAALGRIAKDSQHDLERYEKMVAEAKALVDQVDSLISMTRIESPIDGIVGQVLTQEGEQVVAELEAVKIVTIIDPRFLDLWIFINEADAAGIRPGMPVRFFLPSKKDQIIASQVDRMSPAPEIVDKVLYYPAIAPLPQQTATLLRPEMNVQCFVLVEDLKGVLSVPNEAVVSRGGKRRVYVDDGRGGAREIEPIFGPRGSQRTQVLSGLDPGTKVAVKFTAKEAK